MGSFAEGVLCLSAEKRPRKPKILHIIGRKSVESARKSTSEIRRGFFQRFELLVSDDRSKGTCVIYNQINPQHYTTITPKELDSQLGPTHLHYHDRKQFMAVLASTIKQRMEDPYPVYPVNSRHTSPLDTFPNIDAIEAVQRDFQTAVTLARKRNIADLRMSDIATIPSKKVVWSFGGAACGSAYLDRLATEFGLDASRMTAPENTIEQHEYREQIFRLLLWELNPVGYRGGREVVYAKANTHGHASNILRPRKRRKKSP